MDAEDYKSWTVEDFRERQDRELARHRKQRKASRRSRSRQESARWALSQLVLIPDGRRMTYGEAILTRFTKEAERDLSKAKFLTEIAYGNEPQSISKRDLDALIYAKGRLRALQPPRNTGEPVDLNTEDFQMFLWGRENKTEFVDNILFPDVEYH